MMRVMRYRTIQRLLLLISLLVLISTFYFEYVMGLRPCPLCLMQRVCIFLFALVCLGSLFIDTLRYAKGLAWVQMIFAAAGFFFAARQTWLQSLPEGASTSCMPNIGMLIHYFSKDELLKAFFWGTGDCAEVTARWLGLSMAAWSAIFFAMLFLGCAMMMWFIGRQLLDLKLS